MSPRQLDQLRVIASQIEAHISRVRKLGLDETALLLEMVALDLNRQIYEGSMTLGSGPVLGPAATLKPSRH
jgi:hypothetical protein